MTAKCVIRDMLKRIRCAPSEREAGIWAGEMIRELFAEGYEIRPVVEVGAPRDGSNKRRPSIGDRTR